MRTVTTLSHQTQEVGVLWDAEAKKGNYDNWGRLPVTEVVLHTTPDSIHDTGEAFKVEKQSAHYGVDPDGVITAWIPEEYVSYHAGTYLVNQVSIGIVFPQAASDASLESGAHLIADICKEYSMLCDTDHIRLHSEITRVACPTDLDRVQLLSKVNDLLAPAVTTPPAAPTTPANQSGIKGVSLDPTVFANTIIKSSEYTELFKQLGIDPELALQTGSNKLVLDYIEKRVSDTIDDQFLPLHVILNKDITQIFSEFLMFLHLKKKV